MKTKKCGVYAALAAVLLITAMLVITCTDPLTPGGLAVQKDGEEKTYTPPPGKAYIRIVLPTETARTILPDTLDLSALFYKVDIVGTSGTTETYDESNLKSGTFAGTGQLYDVEAGTYNITVSAYNNASTFTIANQVVTGTSSNVAVAAGTGKEQPVTLVRTMNGDTTPGTFSYNISTVAAAPNDATLVVSDYPGGGNPVSRDIKTTPSGSITNLDSGYHWVKVTIEKDKHTTVTYSHVLHIYGNQNSTWGTVGDTPEPIVLAAGNRNVYDVIYNQNYSGAPAASTDTTGFLHGGAVTKHATYGNPTRTDDYTVEGWYKETGTTNKWHFTDAVSPDTPTLIYKDTTLYAKWQYTGAGTEGPLTITVSYTDPTEKSFGFSPSSATFYQTQAFTASISVAASGFDALGTGGGWYYNGKLVVANATLDSAAITAYNELGTTDPADEIDITVVGPHTFTFTANVGTAPAETYSGTFIITTEADLP